MSDEFKYELAKDLGFYDTVKNGGWGEIRARDAGNMVKRAIELAQQHGSGRESTIEKWSGIPQVSLAFCWKSQCAGRKSQYSSDPSNVIQY